MGSVISRYTVRLDLRITPFKYGTGAQSDCTCNLSSFAERKRCGGFAVPSPGGIERRIRPPVAKCSRDGMGTVDVCLGGGKLREIWRLLLVQGCVGA